MRLSLILLAAQLSAVPAVAQLTMGPRLSPGGALVLDAPAAVTPPAPAATATRLLAPDPTAPATDPLPATDVLTGVATPKARSGQQHWVSVNWSAPQPFAGRVGVKVWDRPNGSLWLEAYGGSALFDWMYGFGARMQFTVKEFGSGDQLMVSPGFGAHVLPQWQAETSRYYTSGYYSFGYYTSDYKRNNLYFLAADVDISWLHDFSPHFGYEIGLKLGLAFRVAGDVGDSYPGFVMFGRNLYPVISVYSGFRF